MNDLPELKKKRGRVRRAIAGDFAKSAAGFIVAGGLLATTIFSANELDTKDGNKDDQVLIFLGSLAGTFGATVAASFSASSASRGLRAYKRIEDDIERLEAR